MGGVDQPVAAVRSPASAHGLPPGSETRRTRRVVVLVCVAVVVVRLVQATLPLRPDEGGYLLVARSWAPGSGEFLYGDYHVDRPPGLMAVFLLAATWDGAAAIRVITVPVVVATVVALSRAGQLLAGHRAARTSAVVTGSLLCSPALAGDEADGELFAVALVATSIVLALQAHRTGSGRTALLCWLGAGLTAACATLVKQNLVDGLVFVAALLVARWWRDRSAGDVLGGAVAALTGTLAAYVGVAVWAWSVGVEPSQLLSELVTFRGDATETILGGSLRAPTRRALALVVLSLVSMLGPVLWIWWRWRRGRRGRPTGVEQAALVWMVAVGTLAVALGGSYWPHYLLQLVPGVALAAGLVVADTGATGARRAPATMRRAVAACVASAVLANVVLVAAHVAVPSASAHEDIGSWLEESSHSGDTAYVAYGSPQILEYAGLASPYPYLWSLQMRTLDPHQARLRATLAGSDAPAWVVQVLPLDSWGIDRGDRLRSLLGRRYRVVARVCGEPVLLRRDLRRDLAELPSCGRGAPSWP